MEMFSIPKIERRKLHGAYRQCFSKRSIWSSSRVTLAPRSQRLAYAHTRTAFESARRSLKPMQTSACTALRINEAHNGGFSVWWTLSLSIRNNQPAGRDPAISRQLYSQRNVSIRGAMCCSNGFPNPSPHWEFCRAIVSSQRGRLSTIASNRSFYLPFSWWCCHGFWCCLCSLCWLLGWHYLLTERHFEQHALQSKTRKALLWETWLSVHIFGYYDNSGSSSCSSSIPSSSPL